MFASSVLLRGVCVCPEGSFVTTADPLGDGIYRVGFVSDRSLGVYSGGRVVASYPLPDAPLALSTMRLPQFAPPRDFFVILFARYVGVYGVLRPAPGQGGAGGMELAPIARYTLSLSLGMRSEEAEIFSRYLARQIASGAAAEELRALGRTLAQSGAVLSDFSQRFLSLPDPEGDPKDGDDQQYPSTQPQEGPGAWEHFGASGWFLAAGGPPGASGSLSPQAAGGAPRPGPAAPPAALNRARLLDGLTPAALASAPDGFTCMAALKMAGQGQDSTCLVLGTAGGKLLVLGPDLCTALLALELPQPAAQLCIEGQVSEAQGVSSGTWRATILGREGLVMSLRGGALSKNQILPESLPHFVSRIGNSIYCITSVPLPCTVVRMTPRGRMDYCHTLPSAFACGSMIDMVHGKPFRGFVFGLHDASLVFFNANGPTIVAPLSCAEEDWGRPDGVPAGTPAGAPAAPGSTAPPADGNASGSSGKEEGRGKPGPGAASSAPGSPTPGSPNPGSPTPAAPPPAYFKHIHFGRIGEADDALVCVRGDGGVVVNTLARGYDLNRPQGQPAAPEPAPFDVELGAGEGPGAPPYPVEALELQQEQFHAFLASRAFAKATVLGELVEAERRPGRRSAPPPPSGLSYSAEVSLSTNLATLVLTVANPTPRPSAPAAVALVSEVLQADEAAALTPALPPGGSAVLHFALRPRKLTGEEKIVPAHAVYLLAAPPGAPEGCRPEAVLEVAVPEFRAA